MSVQIQDIRPVLSTVEQAQVQRQLELRQQRQLAMSDTRRSHVLDAARRVFAERGVQGASIREIAREAGYTPGALYSYFDSKEAILAALLAEVLERLQGEVQGARVSKGVPGRTLMARAQAWFGFFLRQRRDLDLTLYLTQGGEAGDLTTPLDRALNERLMQALRPCEHALEEMGLANEDAVRENASLFAYGMGLLMLQRGGRLEQFGQDARGLFAQYLERLAERADPSSIPPTRSQQDLFAV